MRGSVSLGWLYRDVRDRFRKANLDTPDLDARLLISHALALEPVVLVTEPNRQLSPALRSKVDQIAQRRLDREPVARIIGEREFWSRSFRLSATTLEPRPDTETLVETVSKRLHSWTVPSSERTRPALRGPRILDVGTGTGIILVSLLAEFPDATGLATDISFEALQTARGNARRHNVGDRARFVCADYLTCLRGGFDVIVSNPPYIPTAEITELSPEVSGFDPIAALDGGNDGLDAYRAIFGSALSNLFPGGFAAVEFGSGQSRAIGEIALASGFSTVESARDLGDRERVVLVKSAEEPTKQNKSCP